MGEANGQLSPDAGYDVQRSVTELAEYGHYALSRLRKPVAVADVAFANGGDLQLLRLLGRKGMLPRLAGIAGWNTSANSIGTVLAQLMLYGRFGCTGSHLDFLGLRIAEDYGYCSAVRRQLADGPIKELGMDYFAVDGQSGRAAGMVREELAGFLERELAGSGLSVKILDCRMPWRRMFEVGLSVTAGTDEGRSDADVTGAAGAVPAEGCGESELSAAGRSGMREPSMEKAASAADNNEARG